jgi:hypothetical protein
VALLPRMLSWDGEGVIIDIGTSNLVPSIDNTSEHDCAHVHGGCKTTCIICCIFEILTSSTASIKVGFLLYKTSTGSFPPRT